MPKCLREINKLKVEDDENALLRNYKGCIQEFTFQASK